MSQSLAKRRIGFVTESYLADLTADDRRVLPYLREAGIEVVPVIWSDPVLPDGLSALVLRSTWAYYRQPEAFRAWLDSLEASGLPVFNPLAMLRDNLDKRYLLRLAAAGWPLVPTALLDLGEASSYQALLQAKGWQDVIVKPVISASGNETHRLSADQALPDSLRNLNASTPLLVQPFCEAIQTEGELSLLFFASASGPSFSHAVRKIPGQGHHLVQENYGGRTEAAAPPPELLALATRLAHAECSEALYIRIDCVRHQGDWKLMELELLEPSLYLAHEPGAAARWAQAILSLI